MKRVRHSLLSLRIFVLVAEFANTSRAGYAANLTQGAVTKHIQALEGYVGTDLFERKPPGMVLTPAGRKFLTAVSTALRTLDDGMASLRGPVSAVSGVSGEVRLGVAPAFAQRFLISRLQGFQDEFPGVVLRLVPRKFSGPGQEQAPDAHIQTGNGRFVGYRSTYLIGSELRVVVAPSRLKKRPSKDSRNAGVAVTGLMESMPLLTHMLVPKMWDEALGPLGVLSTEAPSERVYFEQYSVLIPAAVAGIGLGLVPTFLLSDELQRGTLVCVGPPLSSRLGFHILTPTGTQRSAATEALVKWLQRECALFDEKPADKPVQLDSI